METETGHGDGNRTVKECKLMKRKMEKRGWKSIGSPSCFCSFLSQGCFQQGVFEELPPGTWELDFLRHVDMSFIFISGRRQLH